MLLDERSRPTAHESAAAFQKEETTVGAAKVRKKNDPEYGKKSNVIQMPSLKIVKSAPPHYTAEMVIPMFESGAIELGGNAVVPLASGQSGLLTFSDKNGGLAQLVHPTTYKPLASFDAVIIDEMRQSKCTHPDCKCGNDKWDELLTGCTSDQHEDHFDDALVPVRLFASLCDNPACAEQHVWLLSECIDSHTHHNSHTQMR